MDKKIRPQGTDSPEEDEDLLDLMELLPESPEESQNPPKTSNLTDSFDYDPTRDHDLLENSESVDLPPGEGDLDPIVLDEMEDSSDVLDNYESELFPGDLPPLKGPSSPQAKMGDLDYEPGEVPDFSNFSKGSQALQTEISAPLLPRPVVTPPTVTQDPEPFPGSENQLPKAKKLDDQKIIDDEETLAEMNRFLESLDEILLTEKNPEGPNPEGPNLEGQNPNLAKSSRYSDSLETSLGFDDELSYEPEDPLAKKPSTQESQPRQPLPAKPAVPAKKTPKMDETLLLTEMVPPIRANKISTQGPPPQRRVSEGILGLKEDKIFASGESTGPNSQLPDYLLPDQLETALRRKVLGGSPSEKEGIPGEIVDFLASIAAPTVAHLTPKELYVLIEKAVARGVREALK
ncbi:MAG: hypothetical protein LBF22_05965 [Deltaproteobacteria bacterium]|jgi:hypothetical protein|nr:hypothetical protein [Deltaproteobacteria bacterium]